MFKLDLSWHEFNVSLPMFNAWIKELENSNYLGMSADAKLSVWFTNKPSAENLYEIEAKWHGLSESSEEAVAYVSYQTIRNKIEELKVGLVSKGWDEMSVAERKIVLGQIPTVEELGL